MQVLTLQISFNLNEEKYGGLTDQLKVTDYCTHVLNFKYYNRKRIFTQQDPPSPLAKKTRIKQTEILNP